MFKLADVHIVSVSMFTCKNAPSVEVLTHTQLSDRRLKYWHVAPSFINYDLRRVFVGEPWNPFSPQIIRVTEVRAKPGAEIQNPEIVNPTQP